MGVLTLDDKIEKFLTIGSGSGYGDGYGYGDGSGYGYGDGSGFGSGSGSGYGSGYGYGSGSGSGDGDGYGSGSGYGSGYGDGIKEFDGHKLYDIDKVPTAITAVHGSYAEGFTIRHNSQKVLCYIARVGDFFAHGATLKDARRDAQLKFDNTLPTEEKIQRFLAFCDGKGYIPAADLFQWHHTLTGSCEMGRREFCNAHNIDISNDKFTLEEFIELTINSFGGKIIQMLKNKYYDTERKN